ncbi:MAG: putative dipeptidase [Chloroflexi bacterium]|nr:putative dipeptidase [Chloroflexota bacterium]
MLENIDSHLAAQQAPLKAALVELVRIPSVCDEGAGGYPFGAAIDQALRKALQIAGDLGFRTQYGDGGYYGYAEVGEGAEMLGILGHLDVVPPGKLEDWEHDPFDPIEKDGMLYGRGTQDDKGPLLAALFAVKALMDAGIKFNKRVRFIFGADEETLWRCINRYKEKEELPGMGFSPDSKFPVTYAEKGLLQLRLEGRNDSGVRLAGGSAFNAVPDFVLYDGVRQDDLARKLTELGFAFERRENGIEVKGKAAHAMIPEEGINAIARLCIALRAIGIHSKAIDFVAQEIGEDPNARRIFGEYADAPSGKLKFNLGMVDLGELEQLSIDSRIPVTVPKAEIVSKLSTAAARYGLAYKEFDWLAPLYLPQDHFVVTTLMNVYRQYSGDTVTEPRSSGGATYARAMDNCVAFGALTVDELLTEHQPNERAVLQNLYKAMEIYAHAVFELTR